MNRQHVQRPSATVANQVPTSLSRSTATLDAPGGISAMPGRRPYYDFAALPLHAPATQEREEPNSSAGVVQLGRNKNRRKKKPQGTVVTTPPVQNLPPQLNLLPQPLGLPPHPSSLQTSQLVPTPSTPSGDFDDLPDLEDAREEDVPEGNVPEENDRGRFTTSTTTAKERGEEVDEHKEPSPFDLKNLPRASLLRSPGESSGGEFEGEEFGEKAKGIKQERPQGPNNNLSSPRERRFTRASALSSSGGSFGGELERGEFESEGFEGAEFESGGEGREQEEPKESNNNSLSRIPDLETFEKERNRVLARLEKSSASTSSLSSKPKPDRELSKKVKEKASVGLHLASQSEAQQKVAELVGRKPHHTGTLGRPGGAKASTHDTGNQQAITGAINKAVAQGDISRTDLQPSQVRVQAAEKEKKAKAESKRGEALQEARQKKAEAFRAHDDDSKDYLATLAPRAWRDKQDNLGNTYRKAPSSKSRLKDLQKKAEEHGWPKDWDPDDHGKQLFQ